MRSNIVLLSLVPFKNCANSPWASKTERVNRLKFRPPNNSSTSLSTAFFLVASISLSSLSGLSKAISLTESAKLPVRVFLKLHLDLYTFPWLSNSTSA